MFVPTLFYVALAAASAVPALGMYTDAAGVLRRGDIHDRLLARELNSSLALLMSLIKVNGQSREEQSPEIMAPIPPRRRRSIHIRIL